MKKHRRRRRCFLLTRKRDLESHRSNGPQLSSWGEKRIMFIGAMKRFVVGVLGILSLSSRPSLAQPLNADDIVRRSVELTKKDWEQTPGYDYFERDQEPGRT